MALNLHTLSLSEIRAGESAVVRDFPHGHGIAGRLTSLGFTPGVEVQMTQNFGRGPLIVTVRGTRVALGRGEAAKICVEKNLA
jgi:ferrous iron transport protein A